MTLKLQKIEDSFYAGEILYHSFIKKTPEEIAALKKKQDKVRLDKLRRKQEQGKNVEKKKKQKEEIAAAKAAAKEPEVESDDDAKYYEQEVGEKPEPGLFSTTAPQQKREKFNPLYRKKPKKEEGGGETSVNKDKNFKRKHSQQGQGPKRRKTDGGDKGRGDKGRSFGGNRSQANGNPKTPTKFGKRKSGKR